LEAIADGVAGGQSSWFLFDNVRAPDGVPIPAVSPGSLISLMLLMIGATHVMRIDS